MNSTQPTGVQNTFSEGDLHTAAFLLISGAKLLRCEPDPNNHSSFVWTFSNEGNRVSQALVDYANGAEVPAIKFAQAMSQLKRLLHAVSKAGGAR